jgi:hypothetical protein
MELQVLMKVELPDDLGGFQEAESKVSDAMFKGGSELLLKVIDLFESRVLEKKGIWMKDRRRKTFDTRVGRIIKNRLRVLNPVSGELFYPLDRWMELDCGVTPGLKETIIETTVERSYRKATEEVYRWTRVKRSPMSNWNLIQREAQALRSSEKPTPDWRLKPMPYSPTDDDPCPILAIDPDGTYCQNQNESLPNHDVKVAVLYTAKEMEGKDPKRRQLKDKIVLFSQSWETIDDFFNRVTQTAFEHYGAHNRTKVVIHGDGDLWIKRLKTDWWDGALLRLDLWHLNEKIRRSTGLKEIPSQWRSAMFGNPDLLISQVRFWKLQHTKPGSKEREKVEELITYIRNNREGLLPSGVPIEVKKKYPGMFVRSSGPIESNIGHEFNVRFKGKRMSWTARGLDNLSYLREKHINRHRKPQYLVPQPLTRERIAHLTGRTLH